MSPGCGPTMRVIWSKLVFQHRSPEVPVLPKSVAVVDHFPRKMVAYHGELSVAELVGQPSTTDQRAYSWRVESVVFLGLSTPRSAVEEPGGGVVNEER
jgi:hypothetical protein